jgi:apolipoprotein N-acyltransferase
VYRANGERFTYAKHHLIPGIEAPFAPGSSTLRFDGAGIAICKDLDFQDTARENAGARVLFVPAWDFTSDAELHRRMAVMRGVEGGFALVRSARDGYLSVHDAWGRLLAEKRSSAEAVALAIVDVPVIARHPPMLATELGIAMIVIALGCGVLVVRGSRPRR